MIYQFDDTQDLMRDSARAVCTEIREKVARDNALATLWSQGIELGWQGVALPEELGGAGASLIDAAVIAYEIGRAGLFGGYAETVALSYALAAAKSASPFVTALVGKAAAGEVELRFAQKGGIVSSLSCANAYAIVEENGALVAIKLQDQKPLALTSRQRDLRISDSDARETLLVDGGKTFAKARRIQRGLAAAQCIGAMRALLDISVEYSRIRHQFGKPIGSFQAVQHTSVDILAGGDAAECMLFNAVAVMDRVGGAQVPALDSAVAFAREQTWSALIRTYDVLGGVGFVEEHPVSLYSRGILPILTSLGSAADCEEAVAASVKPGRWLTLENEVFA